jgi:hypothetical protein
MTAFATQSDTMDRALEAICMLLMPFFLLGAGDDPEKAHRAVADLIQAYNPGTTQELDLAARIIGFSSAALDNLCLSMTSPTLSDTKVLRYRSAAVSLGRSAEQCRMVLQKMQQEQPSPKTARPPEEKLAAPVQPQAPGQQPPVPRQQPPVPEITAAHIEKARSDARSLLAGLAKAGMTQPPGYGLTGPHSMPDPGAQISAAVTAALAAYRTQPMPRKPNQG